MMFEVKGLWRHDMAVYITLRNRSDDIRTLLEKRRFKLNELTIYDLILIGHLKKIGKIKDVVIV
jgi:hypothetical protein